MKSLRILHTLPRQASQLYPKSASCNLHSAAGSSSRYLPTPASRPASRPLPTDTNSGRSCSSRHIQAHFFSPRRPLHPLPPLPSTQHYTAPFASSCEPTSLYFFYDVRLPSCHIRRLLFRSSLLTYRSIATGLFNADRTPPQSCLGSEPLKPLPRVTSFPTPKWSRPVSHQRPNRQPPTTNPRDHADILRVVVAGASGGIGQVRGTHWETRRAESKPRASANYLVLSASVPAPEALPPR